MAARMHLAGYQALEGHVSLLQHRKSIHVGAEGNDWMRAVANGGDHTWQESRGRESGTRGREEERGRVAHYGRRMGVGSPYREFVCCGSANLE